MPQAARVLSGRLGSSQGRAGLAILYVFTPALIYVLQFILKLLMGSPRPWSGVPCVSLLTQGVMHWHDERHPMSPDLGVPRLGALATAGGKGSGRRGLLCKQPTPGICPEGSLASVSAAVALASARGALALAGG